VVDFIPTLFTANVYQECHVFGHMSMQVILHHSFVQRFVQHVRHNTQHAFRRARHW